MARTKNGARSPEEPWGFEEYHAGEEVGDGSEEFVWCNDNELNSKMEGIWPIGYPNFRLHYYYNLLTHP